MESSKHARCHTEGNSKATRTAPRRVRNDPSVSLPDTRRRFCAEVSGQRRGRWKECGKNRSRRAAQCGDAALDSWLNADHGEILRLTTSAERARWEGASQQEQGHCDRRLRDDAGRRVSALRRRRGQQEAVDGAVAVRAREDGRPVSARSSRPRLSGSPRSPLASYRHPTIPLSVHSCRRSSVAGCATPGRRRV